jgi:hypothetical protein
MGERTVRLGKHTGQTISWYAASPEHSNACCLYCGRSLRGQSAPKSDKEHLIARNFAPAGTMGGDAFNFLFRACRECNARKAHAERHVSSVTLFNSPSRQVDTRADDAALRKGRGDFHPHKKGVLVQDAHEQLTIRGSMGPMSINFGMLAPPPGEFEPGRGGRVQPCPRPFHAHHDRGLPRPAQDAFASPGAVHLV